MDLLIVSGDNSSKLYNEPVAMQQALIAAGIPDSAIFLDYAGLRTFDSMVRLKEIFGIDSAIVVSQEFHNQLAVFIANKLSMHVIGYNAEDISHNSDFNINLREYLAKSKALIDFWIGVNPKFRGEQIPLQHLTCRASAE
ncbi:MAG: YdcF family protein [Bacteroidetes bacterium]|nr:YdcF family protein [Bacteroidota bacterium]